MAAYEMFLEVPGDQGSLTLLTPLSELSPCHSTQFHSTCSPVTLQQICNTQQSLPITPTSVHGPCHATLQILSRKGPGLLPHHVWKHIQSTFTLSAKHCGL